MAHDQKYAGAREGPGVDALHVLHRLGGDITPAGEEGSLFVQSDTFRKCVFGYFARQRRRMNQPCPTCPVRKLSDGTYAQGCNVLTFDGKRLRTSMRHRNSNGEVGYTPDQVLPRAPHVNCKDRVRTQRHFWSGKDLRESRSLARSLAASILGIKIKKNKKEIDITSARLSALCSNVSVPEAYRESLRILKAHFNSLVPVISHESPESSDCDVDDDDIDDDESDVEDDCIFDQSSSTPHLSPLVRELSIQFFGICNEQCEGNQWLRASDLEVLRGLLPELR